MSVEGRTDVRAMFERIATTYDRVNRAMTFGLDRAWRTATIAEVPADARTVLDLCAGTLDLAAEVARTRPGVRIAAVDFAARMLAEGRAKVGAGLLDTSVQLACADASSLPYRSGAFDVALCGFGIRNLPDRSVALAELRRVLRPGGVLAVLDLFVPDRAVARLVHEIHTQAIVPVLGRVLSGDAAAYSYLPGSVDRFVTRRTFERELRAAGFADVRGHDVGFGTVSIVRAS